MTINSGIIIIFTEQVKKRMLGLAEVIGKIEQSWNVSRGALMYYCINVPVCSRPPPGLRCYDP